jgi:hypothetical protein
VCGVETSMVRGKDFSWAVALQKKEIKAIYIYIYVYIAKGLY